MLYTNSWLDLILTIIFPLDGEGCRKATVLKQSLLTLTTRDSDGEVTAGPSLEEISCHIEPLLNIQPQSLPRYGCIFCLMQCRGDSSSIIMMKMMMMMRMLITIMRTTTMIIMTMMTMRMLMMLTTMMMVIMTMLELTRNRPRGTP